MQFQVPQFIETEDKIVGPLSLRQFIYLAAAGGVSLTLYFVVQMWLWFIISIPLVAAGIALAFIRVGGRSLPVIARAALSFVWKPQTYVWQPEKQGSAKQEVLSDKESSTDLSLETVLSGLALRKTWQKLQTGTGKISPSSFFGKAQDRYAIFQKKSGEQGAARRIDYR